MLKRFFDYYKICRVCNALKKINTNLELQQNFVSQIEKLLKTEAKKLDDLIKQKMELESELSN